MGVFIDYELSAECTDEDLRRCLEKIRQRCLDLPLRSVGQVRRIAPVYNPVYLDIFLAEGHPLPEAVAERIRAIEDEPKHGDLCLAFQLPLHGKFSEDFQKRYFAPAWEFMEKTTLWEKESLPEEVKMSAFGRTTMTISRGGIELEFASVLLRYGYVLLIDPGEGSETVAMALSTFGASETGSASALPLWYGQNFTKTQYAKDFIQVHETVCRVLDIAAEEGLLFSGGDTCGYYASRTWEEASKRVNEELIFARAVSGLIDVGIGNLREEGGQAQVLVNNAGKAKPVDFSSVLLPRPDKTE